MTFKEVITKIPHKTNKKLYLIEGCSDDMWFTDCPGCGRPWNLDYSACPRCSGMAVEESIVEGGIFKTGPSFPPPPREEN